MCVWGGGGHRRTLVRLLIELSRVFIMCECGMCVSVEFTGGHWVSWCHCLTSLRWESGRWCPASLSHSPFLPQHGGYKHTWPSPGFDPGAGIHAQVLTFVQQVLLPTEHLSSPSSFLEHKRLYDLFKTS